MVEHRPLRPREPPEAQRAGQPIEGHGGVAKELGERPTTGPRKELELEAAVLPVAEPQSEPGVGIVRCLDVRDAPSVAADRYGRADASDAEPAAGPRTTPAEQPQQRAEGGTVGHRRHDATVYSAP